MSSHTALFHTIALGSFVAFPHFVAAQLMPLQPATGYQAERILTTLESPRDLLALDANTVLISEFDAGRISAFDPETGALAARSTGHQLPIGIVPGPGNQVFVSEEGGFVGLSTEQGREVVTALGGSTTYAVTGPNGDWVYFSRFGAGIVTRVNENGDSEDLVTGLNGPEGLAFAGDTLLLVAEFNANRITEVNLETDQTRTLFDNVVQPYRIRFDPEGNLWVAETDADRITRFSPSGDRETMLEGINFPSSFEFAANGTVYITEFDEFSNNRGALIELTEESTNVEQWTQW